MPAGFRLPSASHMEFTSPIQRWKHKNFTDFSPFLFLDNHFSLSFIDPKQILEEKSRQIQFLVLCKYRKEEWNHFL